jgi:hypothetical protein
MDDARVLDGYLVRNNPELNNEIIEKKLCSDDILKKGVLFVGSSRQGKTNVMIKTTSDILSSMNDNDVMVIFDVKGDYKGAFYMSGDIVLSPTEDDFIWNIFEELKNIPFGNDLDLKIRETVEYLYYGQTSASEPFWGNAAKIITYCFIMYLLLEADINDDDSNLNHYALCQLIDGTDRRNADAYEIYNSYVKILNSYDKFSAANLFLPPLESGNMGPGVMTEVMIMRQRMFSTKSFGDKIRRKNQFYISPGIIPKLGRKKMVFLEYNPEYSKTCTPVFRCFIDMIISEYLNTNNKNGKLYLMLDELAVLPELQKLSFALTLGAGPGIRVMAAFQTIEHIRDIYQSHPHNANVLIGAFQSQVVFNSDIDTLQYFQKLLGKAQVQRMYIKPGGGIGYTSSIQVDTVEIQRLQQLKVGQALVHFSGEQAFIKKFPIYK